MKLRVFFKNLTNIFRPAYYFSTDELEILIKLLEADNKPVIGRNKFKSENKKDDLRENLCAFHRLLENF